MIEAERPEAPASIGERLYRWLDARFGVAKLVEFARHKEVPVGGHSMVWYYLGGRRCPSAGCSAPSTAGAPI